MAADENAAEPVFIDPIIDLEYDGVVHEAVQDHDAISW
jgi:hypothetical protein